MKQLTLSLAFLFTLCLFAQDANAQRSNKGHILITSKMDTLRGIEILSLNKQTNAFQVTYLNKVLERETLESKDVHAFYNGTYHQSETIGKSKDKVIVAYEVKGPLSFGYSRDLSGDYSFYLKQGLQVVEIPEEEAKTARTVSNFVINYREFKRGYKKTIYPEYKSLAEMTSAYNAFINPKRYKRKRYVYLENPKMGAYASVNYDVIRDIGFQMKYSFNVGLAIENAYARHLKVLFIPSIGVSEFKRDQSFQSISLKTLGIEGAIGYSYKGDGDFELNVGPTIGAKYFFDSNFTTTFPEASKVQAIETLKVTWGLAAWATLNDRWRASARYINYDLQISATGFDNLFDRDNGLNIGSLQLGAYYRFN